MGILGGGDLGDTARQVLDEGADPSLVLENIRLSVTLVDQLDAHPGAPSCTACGGIVKTATISFGQPMPEDEMRRAERLTRECDLFLAVAGSRTHGLEHPGADSVVDRVGYDGAHTDDRGLSASLGRFILQNQAQRRRYTVRLAEVKLLETVIEKQSMEEKWIFRESGLDANPWR